MKSRNLQILLALAIALTAPLAATAQEDQRCRRCDADEVRAASRQTINTELARVRAEIDRLRAARRAQDDPDGVVARALLEVEERLRESESHLRMMMQEPHEMADMKEMPRPRAASRARPYVAGQQAPGYIGVSLSGLARTERTSRGTVHRFSDYPVLVSVEPGSPAAEAGLLAGDVLLACNGEDVKARGVALGTFRPQSQLRMRVRRGTDVKDVLVNVEQRPRGFVRVWPDVTVQFDPAVGALVQPPRPPRSPRTPTVSAPPRPAEPAEPAEPSSPAMVLIAPFEGSFTTSPILGAELTRMVDDLREVFNVDRGVLVLSVADGTPAERAGLRGGDVIVAVDDRPISRPLELQRALRRLDKREVRLDVVRKQKKEQVRRTLTLAW